MRLQFYTATVAYINRKKVSLVIRVCVSGDTFIHPHENDKPRVCAPCIHHAYHRRVALCKRSKRPASQPANQGFIITRWHRAIRAGQSLTSVKHVGIIARNKGFL